jgi:allantoinase
LWEYVPDGTIDTIGSGHAPNLPAQIERDWDNIFATAAGRAKIETSLALMLVAVNQGRMELKTRPG